MNQSKRHERLQRWNEERQPALVREMFERVLDKADDTYNLPPSIREINRRLRASQERK